MSVQSLERRSSGTFKQRGIFKRYCVMESKLEAIEDSWVAFDDLVPGSLDVRLVGWMWLSIEPLETTAPNRVSLLASKPGHREGQ